jgi:hypothetical protein
MGSGAGLVLSGLLLLVPGCGEGAEPVHEHTSPLPVPAFEASRTALDCADRVRAAFDAAAMPGVPALNAARLRLLATAKGEPVVFVRAPVRQLAAGSSAEAWAGRLDATHFPWDVVHRLVPWFFAEPALGRAVVLREGYFYAETPELAFALTDQLAVHHLFREPRLWIQRGDRTLFALRTASGRYVWESGFQAGKPVSLLLFDRIGTESPGPALTRDFRSLRHRMHFDRVRIRHVTENEIVADLRYGDQWVETLLRSDGTRLEFECETLDGDRRPARDAWRDRAARHARAIQSLRRAMIDQIDEAIPFDEPMTELGQQDGRLRPAWRRAYFTGETSYRFNVDRYPVFDAAGRPIPPQICLDFLTDTLERASGTWWGTLGAPRERLRGHLDFEQHGLVPRSVERFAAFTERRSDWFETRVIPESERIPIGRLEQLLDWLLAHAGDHQVGDMVFIHGWTPWDPREPHYHSFFIYESDPVTGFPLAIAGNAGRPSIRVWRTESARTPKRVFVRRIRPRLEWLETIVSNPLTREADGPAPLAVAPAR